MESNLEVTRADRKVVTKAYDLQDRDARDPVVIATMGCLELEAKQFAAEQQVRLKTKTATKTEVRFSINVWVARQDAMFNLTRKQMDYLGSVCFAQVGMRETP